jgi:hypothetical protein
MKLKEKVFFLFFIFMLFFMLVSCFKNYVTQEEKLLEPINLVLDENEVLTWDEVEGAQSYDVSINNKIINTLENKLDLFYEIIDSSLYEIKIKAKAKHNENDSLYSEKIEYQLKEFISCKADISDNGIILTKPDKNKAKGKILIPSMVGNYKVIGVDREFFNGYTEVTGIIFGDNCSTLIDSFCDMKNLRFINLNNISSINKSFLNDYNLEKVIMSESLTKIKESFKNTKIKELYIPKSIKEIDGRVFSGCNCLEKIEISPDNNYFYVEKNCIINKSNKKLIRAFKNYIIPNDIKTLAWYSFSGLDVDEIEIPSTIERIDRYCFFECKNLKKIIFNSTIESIDASALTGCSNLEKIELNDNLKYEVLNNCLIDKEKGSVVLGCNNSTIPTNEEITEIEDYSFIDIGIKKIEIPANIKNIGKQCFKNNKGLEEVIFNEGLEKIDSGAFSYCTNIRKLVFPNSLKESYGFSYVYCERLVKKEISNAFKKTIINLTYYFSEDDCDATEIKNDVKIVKCTIEKESDDYYISSIVYDESIKNIVTPTRKGYKFLGWSLTNDKENIISRLRFVQPEQIDMGTIVYHNYFVNVSDILFDDCDNIVLYSIWEKE